MANAPDQIWQAREGDLVTVPGLHTGPVRVEALTEMPWDGFHAPGSYVHLVWAAEGARGATTFRVDARAEIVSRTLSDADHADAEAVKAARRRAETETVLAAMLRQSEKYGL